MLQSLKSRAAASSAIFLAAGAIAVGTAAPASASASYLVNAFNSVGPLDIKCDNGDLRRIQPGKSSQTQCTSVASFYLTNCYKVLWSNGPQLYTWYGARSARYVTITQPGTYQVQSNPCA